MTKIGRDPIPPEQLLRRAVANIKRLGKQEVRFKLTVEQAHMLLKRAHEGLEAMSPDDTVEFTEALHYLIQGGSAYHSLVAQLTDNQRGRHYYNAKTVLDELLEEQRDDEQTRTDPE